MINYDGPRVYFAIRNNPKQVVEDVRRMSESARRLTEENVALHQRVRELENELNILRARHT